MPIDPCQVISIVAAICIATPIFITALVPLGIFYYFIQIYYGIDDTQWL